MLSWHAAATEHVEATTRAEATARVEAKLVQWWCSCCEATAASDHAATAVSDRAATAVSERAATAVSDRAATVAAPFEAIGAGLEATWAVQTCGFEETTLAFGCC